MSITITDVLKCLRAVESAEIVDGVLYVQVHGTAGAKKVADTLRLNGWREVEGESTPLDASTDVWTIAAQRITAGVAE